jgi:nucleoside-diphosphate-sugar epimerase
MYGAAKAATGIFGSALARQAGIPFVTLRLFNIFGVGEAPQRLIPYLIDCLGRSEPADLTPGDQIRDLTYVDDVVDAIRTAATSRLEPYSAYNICSGRRTQMRWVAETVADMMGQRRSLLRFGALPRREDEPQLVVGSNERFVGATGWRPRVTVEEGIRLMIEDYSRLNTH